MWQISVSDRSVRHVHHLGCFIQVAKIDVNAPEVNSQSVDRRPTAMNGNLNSKKHSASTSNTTDGDPPVKLPSKQSLRFINKLTENLFIVDQPTTDHQTSDKSVMHLRQIIIFLWAPSEFKDEKELFRREILIEMQQYCLSHGAEITLVDPFFDDETELVFQPDLLDLLLEEIDHCGHVSCGPFFVSMLGETLGSRVLPKVLDGAQVQSLQSYLKAEDPTGSVNLKYLYSGNENEIKLIDYSSLNENARSSYWSLCKLISQSNSAEINTQLREVNCQTFPSLQEVFLRRAAAHCPRSTSSQRSLIIWRKVAAIQPQSVKSELSSGEHSGDAPTHPCTDAISTLLQNHDVEIVQAPLPGSNEHPFKVNSHVQYLQKFCRRIVARMKQKLQSTFEHHANTSNHSYSPFDDSHIHIQYANEQFKQPLLGYEELIDRLRDIFQHTLQCHTGSALLLKGAHGQGKTRIICQLANHLLKEWFGNRCETMVRFVRLSPLSSTVHELLRSCCLELCRRFHLDPGLDITQTTADRLFDLFRTICEQAAKQCPERVLVVLLDDVHRLKESSSISDTSVPFWLPPALPTHTVFFMTVNDDAPLEQVPSSRLASAECVFKIPPLTVEMNRKIYEAYLPPTKEITEAELMQLPYMNPLALRLLAEIQAQPEQSIPINNFNNQLSELIEAKLELAEKLCGRLVCATALSYIECAHFGLTQCELFDLLSCQERIIAETSLQQPNSTSHFPVTVWLKLKRCLGTMLEEVLCDDKTVFRWSHTCIIGVVRRRYLNTIQQLKECHSALVALFNNTLPTITNIEVAASKLQCGTLMPRPLQTVTPDGVLNFNLRSIRNLWYHLLHTGSVDFLQAQSLCNFEYLYATIKGAGIFHLKSMFESTMLQLLNHSFHVLYSSILKPSASILFQNCNLLAAEVILNLQYSRENNTKVLNSLLEQAMSWVDSSSDIPLLVPLSPWVKPKICPLVVSCRFQESTTPIGNNLVLEPTLNHQHLLVTGGRFQNSIWMYHTSSRKLVRSFEGHVSNVIYLKTITDGQFFLSCSVDATVMLWNWTQVSCQKAFKAGKGKLTSACAARTRCYLLTGFSDGRICQHSISETTEKLRTFNHHTAPVTAIALTSNDLYMLSGSADFTVTICCMLSGNPISQLSGLMAPVRTIAVTSNDTFALVSCEDESLKVFSICMNTHLLELQGHEGKICSLEIAKDDCRVFAGSSDGKIYCFDLHTGQLMTTQTCHHSAVTCLKTSIDGHFLFSGSTDAFNVWSIYTDGVDLFQEPNYISVMAMSCDFKYGAYGNNSGKIILWDLEMCNGIWATNCKNYSKVTSLQFDNDSVILLSGTADGLIRILSMANGMTLKTFEACCPIYHGHASPVVALRIFSDRSVVLSLDAYGHVILWSTEDTEDYSYEAFCLSDVGSILEFIEDRDVLVSVRDNEKELKILNMVGREEAWTTRGRIQHNDVITCISISGDKQLMVTGSKDQSLKVWEIKPACLTQVLAEHQQPVLFCDVSYDGAIVVSGSENEIFAWDTYSGQSISKFTQHQHPITSLAVTYDGKICISSDQDGWLYAWHTVTGANVAAFNTHMPILKLLLTPDCRRILLKLQNCPHVACLCLHNLPPLEDYIQDSTSREPFNLLPTTLTQRSATGQMFDNAGSAENISHRSESKSNAAADFYTKDNTLRTARSSSGTNQFQRSRSSLRLFDRLNRSHTQFMILNSTPAKCITRAESSVLHIANSNQTPHGSNTCERGSLKQQTRTRVCVLL
ncbi:NACHT and WD repeat domain-containing protein 1 [Trichinella pseudospiralis]|uniref:NACHT and WD repeat domain-containing protein 1 n=1 Tax=Trichinella pseudospiralis TaxID=6337 RepID=A0A0V1JPB1_TRIPS|nr:NACHT and WD repeat domain-containing protein 1 [Trichinella pseudospiralis]